MCVSVYNTVAISYLFEHVYTLEISALNHARIEMIHMPRKHTKTQKKAF